MGTSARCGPDRMCATYRMALPLAEQLYYGPVEMAPGMPGGPASPIFPFSSLISAPHTARERRIPKWVPPEHLFLRPCVYSIEEL
jgi:hypothetical protein